jgi:hypothetical protein
MRKRIVSTTPGIAAAHGEGWLDLERVAVVEVTSEESDHPVEFALVSGETRGWRAAAAGPQTIRLTFDEPRSLEKVRQCDPFCSPFRTSQINLRVWRIVSDHVGFVTDVRLILLRSAQNDLHFSVAANLFVEHCSLIVAAQIWRASRGASLVLRSTPTT